MKKRIYFLFLLLTSVGFSQVIEDFEGTAPTFGDFNGSFTQVIANPDATGVNTSANVAENTVPANAGFAGVNFPVSVIDLTTDKGFTLNVWSPLANTPVLLKLESSTGPPQERLVSLTTSSAWEEITFDFSSLGSETFDSVTLFMNFNQTDGSTQVYYWDNLTQVSLAPPAPSLPITFEGGQLPAFGDFNGSFTQVIANPDATGVNTSANVAENTVPANAGFAGVNFPVSVIDLTTDKGFTLNVWSPLANTPVLLKLESSTGPPQERLVSLTTSSAWEEITFDFSSLGSETFDSVTLFMNFNQTDGSTQVYYWDNLTQVSLAPPAPSLPITFEGGQLPAFGDFNGSFTQVIANPDATGVNTSANVAENTVPANAGFAGVNFPVSVIDLTTDKGFTLNVWSPLANTPVLLKLESSTGPPQERLVSLTTSSAWEEITFDFSSLGSETFDSVTLFMNFNQTDGSTQVYYWDNLTQVSLAPPAPSLPITFEGGQLPAFGDFNGSFTQVIANPDATGVNTSANVAENTVPANAGFAGVNFPVSVIDLTTDKGFTLNVWSPLANTPVLLKLESSTGPPQERLVSLTTSSAWEEITFDFSSLGSETFDSVTLFMNFNQTDGSTQVYYWDNLTQVSLAPPAPSLPITFEGGQLPAFGDFNGSFTQVIANPDATGVNTSANVAENTVPANAGFAGVNFPVSVIDLTTDKGFTLNVWSPLANTPVLLKLESSTGPPQERLVSLTTSSAWEEITFDFSSLGSETFDSVTLFMNFNQTDGSTQVYYWDNLTQVNLAVTSDPVFLPVDFENANAVYDVIGFEGADSEVEANAVPSGINTSATVVRTIKTVGSQFYAGTALGLDAPIDFSVSEKITIKTYSPKANIPVRLKLENANGSQFVELDVNTTVENEWEELTWDLTGQTAGIDFTKVVVFFEFIVDLAGDGSTYYFDDIAVFTPPADNDTCGTAITVACGDTVVSDTLTNTDTGGNAAPDEWYSFTGTGSAEFVTISLCDGGTDYDSTLRVFSDCTLTNEIANNDDFCGVQSELEFESDGTSTYYIMVEGWATSSGNFSLAVSCIPVPQGPPNDLVENAISMSCGDIVAGTTILATEDSAVAPTCDTSVTAPGVWYVYDDTSGLATDITITMCNGATGYDSKLSVYTGDITAPPLTCVTGNDDTCGLQSEVSFQSDGATTYYILVHGFGSGEGNFEIEMICELVPPPNDMIANSIDVDEVGFPYTDPSVATLAATLEAGSPVGCDNAGARGVWYNFVAAADGTATATIVSPGFTGGTPDVSMGLGAAPTNVTMGLGASGDLSFTVNNGPLVGSYDAIAAAFGGEFTADLITGDTVLMIDGDTTGDPNDACDPLLNGGSLSGKIAIARRGACAFTDKVISAQNEGAIAVIVINNQGAPIVMGGDNPDITIPALMIGEADGEALLASFDTFLGLTVTSGGLVGSYEVIAAEFGGEFTSTLITGSTVLMIDDDTTGDPNDACDPLVNGGSLAGKIAIARRGACAFTDKAISAQNAGAIAVIVINNQGAPIVMGGANPDITIPALMIGTEDGEALLNSNLGFNTVTFYTAPNENAVETDLELVDWYQNQCLPGVTATIPTVAGQAYYVFVANHDGVTDIVIDGTNLGTEDNNTIEGFVYYPNPTQSTLNLRAQDNIESAVIYNMLGQKVFDQNVNATTSELNVSDLATGAYILQVSVNGQIGTYQILKK